VNPPLPRDPLVASQRPTRRMACPTDIGWRFPLADGRAPRRCVAIRVEVV
jgi:hypothetical protein